MPTGAPAWLKAWLQQPRASQRGACTGPSSWQEQRQIGASCPSQEENLKLPKSWWPIILDEACCLLQCILKRPCSVYSKYTAAAKSLSEIRFASFGSRCEVHAPRASHAPLAACPHSPLATGHCPRLPRSSPRPHHRARTEMTCPTSRHCRRHPRLSTLLPRCTDRA